MVRDTDSRWINGRKGRDPDLKSLKDTIAVVDSTGMKIKDSDWGNSEIVSDLLFECIESLENLGEYAVNGERLRQ